ncbi:hypothetical protein [Microbacterium sp. Ag1]|uniref:hypothetical protein n=1 Tax=Microbacterium sp. Ag1 TaxID=1643443 RepID=UPI00062904E9|nr:hypothetical protein [Microbacterium sp. Ag1]KKX99698.1 hypothetical protein AAY78_00655 [Microbacterium sp. Ag1]
MPMLTLRERNSGRLAAVNLHAIRAVEAEAAKPNDRTESDAGDSPVYLLIWNDQSGHATRYVTIDNDGDEDKSITDPDEAVRAFASAALSAERWARK